MGGARLVGLVVTLGGLTGAGLGLLISSTPLGFGGQFALAVAGSSALLGGGWMALALWRRADPRWLGRGALGGGLAMLASGAYLLALFKGGLEGDLPWLVAGVVGPPLLAWGLGLALAARFGCLSRAGTLLSALGLVPAMVISWFLYLAALVLPALLLAPLLLTGRGAPPPGSRQAAAALRLGYLALPLTLAVSLTLVLLARW